MEDITERESTAVKTCRRCGREYNMLYRRCPGCGYSPQESLFKLLSLIFIITAMAALMGLTAAKTVALEKAVKELNDSMNAEIELINGKYEDDLMGSDSISEGSYEITNLQYYADQLITSGTDLAELGDDYLIIARQDGCPACEAANEYIYMFLYYGYPDYIPVYFITPESSEEIFYDRLGCTDTPTIYRMSGEKITDMEIGTDGVYEMLDGIVSEIRENEE